jgi:hypothetical protein
MEDAPMTPFLSSRSFAVLAAIAVAALGAAGVYAYLTVNGAGSGAASVGAGSSVTVEGTTGGTLYPGSVVPVRFTADNPSLGHERIGTVYLAGVRACTGAASSWDPSLDGGSGGCSNGGEEASTCESFDPGDGADAERSDFYMPDVTENEDVAGSSRSVALTAAGALKMNNLGSAQDSCEDASIYLHLQTR